MNHSLKPVALAACLLASSFSVFAADEPQSNDSDKPYRVVVTGARTEVLQKDVVADVTVIPAGQIRRSGAVNIVDLLKRQPGLELSRNGGPGTTSSLFMRGADTRFTAVYIDGVRVDSQSTGGAPWEAISLQQVERIEILRGPAAAVYGSDAVAGVIQIFTKRGDGPFTPYVGIGGGNRRTLKAEAGFSGSTDTLDYSLGFERDTSDGYSVRVDGDPDKDGYSQKGVTGRLGIKLNDAHRIDLTGTFNRMDAQYDASRANASKGDDHAINRLYTLGATWEGKWTEAWTSKLSASKSKQTYRTTPNKYYSETELHNYLFQNEWRTGPHLVTGALERREDALVNDPIDRKRHQNGIALGYLYSNDVHSLQLNVRRDQDSEFGGKTSGGISYGYAFAPNWRVTAAYGTAFRVPTLYQRFSEYGQADLKPETGRNVELGIHWKNDASYVDLTAYHNRIRNLINYVGLTSGPGPCQSQWGCYENVGRATLRGINLSAGHTGESFNVGASLDIQDPRNTVTDTLLARRARGATPRHPGLPPVRPASP